MTQHIASYYDLECRRLRLLLKRHVCWLRTRWTVQQDDACQGAAIPDAWADLLLECGLDAEEEARFIEAYSENQRIHNIETTVLPLRAGMPTGALAQAFDLNPFDCDVLILALAPEIDPSIEILYAYALDDVARKYATAQLALGLFTQGLEKRFAAQARLRIQAPLLHYRLLQVEEGPNSGVAFHARPLKLDDRIREFLLGSDSIDSRLLGTVQRAPDVRVPSAHQPCVDDLRERMRRMNCTSIHLAGPADSGKLPVAREVYRSIGRQLVQLDPGRFPVDANEREEFLQVAARESRLGKLAYFLKAPENDPGDRHSGSRFLEWVERLDAPVAVDSAERLACKRPLVSTVMTRPGRQSQAGMWRDGLAEHSGVLSDAISDIVEQFDLGPEGIAQAAEEARGRANGSGVQAANLWQACRAQCGWRMEDLAQKLAPAHTWDDIVLTPDTVSQLREIASQVSQRAQVYERWGFARNIRRGRGISALFSGASGVGKTMSADVLANHLELDLYRIDLAGVVSKYIGETEKNLRRIFDAAEQSGAILFFDEADALFGKRTEVKDSHDRYANIEINYLLQRMEEYRGLAILATNRKSALDKAFLRRLRFLVDFPFPDAAHRRLIWLKSFPKEAPVGDLDFDFLERLEIAGGNIRNIALNAAFLAAGERRGIQLADVLHAVRREYSKIDKLITESEFGPYYGAKR